MDDQLLKELSMEVDNTFADWTVKYNLDCNELFATVMARITRTAIEIDAVDNLMAILSSMIETIAQNQKMKSNSDDDKPIIH